MSPKEGRERGTEQIVEYACLGHAHTSEHVHTFTLTYAHARTTHTICVFCQRRAHPLTQVHTHIRAHTNTHAHAYIHAHTQNRTRMTLLHTQEELAQGMTLLCMARPTSDCDIETQVRTIGRTHHKTTKNRSLACMHTQHHATKNRSLACVHTQHHAIKYR